MCVHIYWTVAAEGQVCSIALGFFRFVYTVSGVRYITFRMLSGIVLPNPKNIPAASAAAAASRADRIFSRDTPTAEFL
jgi:hypothetical protein